MPSGALSAPLRTEPRFVERVWGVTRDDRAICALYPLDASPRPPERARRIGEVWLTGDDNRVAGGPLAGKTLGELTGACAESLLGAAAGKGHPSGSPTFPLLVKFLFTTDKLSVQVHPHDSVAAELGSWGKTEMWHVLHAEPEARIAVDFRGDVPREIFDEPERLRAAAASGAIEQMLNWLPVRAGETYFIPAGTVHAIGAGLTICEIQQNSDITYRLYDYNRPGTDGKPRALHVESSLQVLRAKTPGGVTVPIDWPPTQDKADAARRLLAACPYFATELWSLDAPAEITPAGRVEIWIVIGGAASMQAAGPREVLRGGEAAVIPAAVPALKIHPSPRATLLRTYPPDWEQDIAMPLAKAGFAPADLQRVCFPAEESA